MADLEAQNSFDVESSKAAGDVPAEPIKKSGRFKIAGQVVMAMKRFQGMLQQSAGICLPYLLHIESIVPFAASLNPTYNYGKRSSDGGPVEVVSLLLTSLHEAIRCRMPTRQRNSCQKYDLLAIIPIFPFLLLGLGALA